jgi:hypothetical protein
MADIFKEIIPALLVTKKPVLTNEKDYVPFIINRALSSYYDVIMLANVMNQTPNLDKKLQFDFFLHSIRARKRPYQPWVKKQSVDNLEVVKEYYGYSNEKAQEVLPLLSENQLADLKTALDKGGMNGNRRATK